MKTKLITLLTLLLTVCSGAWAADFVEKWTGINLTTTNPGWVTTISLGTNASISSSRIQIAKDKTGSFTIGFNPTGYTIKSIIFLLNTTDSYISSFTSTEGTVSNTGTKEWTFTPSASPTSATFSVTTGSATQISQVWTTFTDGNSDDNYESLIPTAVSNGTVTCSSTAESSYATITTDGTLGSSSNVKAIDIGSGKKVTITSTKNIKYILFSWYQRYPSEDSHWSPSTGTFSATSFKWTPADATTSSVTFTRTQGSSARISNIHIVYQLSTPTLTGAWMLSDTDVTGETANVVQGSASPTLPTFTVGATSGTPTAADNYNVAYSLKEGSTEGIFTFTDGVPTAISTTTAGSATVVATLTTKDATAFLEPETNTFEYTVSVSAASAPTINVTGAPDGDILVGTEVTLTAEATGVPTPTVTWYDNETNESVGTGDTYVVNTATAGTYSYYAVASNGIGDDATSEVQTIVVKEQVLTPTFTPNGSYFETSQSVTLACETDGATIKYSTDNGETWTDYSEAFSITATTTVKAKAVKDGYIDSEVASATFNKVTLVEQTDVTGAATWDWADFTSGEVLLKAPLLNTDVVMANIAAYGYTMTPKATFDPQALLVNCQYAWRNANSSKFLQGSKVQFNTTVPGVVTIEYANTGSNAARTVKVNDTKGNKSTTANNSYQSESFNVAAGSVEITGVVVSDNTGAMLRIRKIVFTPCETINVAASGWTSLASVLDLDIANATTTTDGADALKAYVISNITKTAVTLTAVESAPAETGLILKGKASTAYTIPVSASPETISKNELSAAVTAETVDAESVYVVSGGELKLFTGTTIPAGKAYLEKSKVDEVGARSLSFFFDDETTGISNVEDAQRQLLSGDFYNLAGQRVAQPAKGLYIVNGRKVVIR